MRSVPPGSRLAHGLPLAVGLGDRLFGMQAVTSFELEAERRREVLEATMRDARRHGTVPAAEEASRPGRLDRIVAALVAGIPAGVAARTRAG
jgi:hypothetical protein